MFKRFKDAFEKHAILSFVLVFLLTFNIGFYIIGLRFRNLSPSTTDVLNGKVSDGESAVFEAITVLQKNYYKPSRLNDACLLNAALVGLKDCLRLQSVNFIPHAIPLNCARDTAKASFGFEFNRAKSMSKCDDEILAYFAIKTMLDSLSSSHTYLRLSPLCGNRDLQMYEFKDSLYIYLSPIGLTVRKFCDKFMYVDKVYLGGPAYNNGVKKLDKIISMNGVPIGRSFYEAKLAFSAHKDSTTISIERKGAKKDIVITWREFTPHEFEGFMIEKNQRHILYMALSSFEDPEAAFAVLKSLILLHPEGVILDLRGNYGGSFYTATQLLSQFFPPNAALLSVSLKSQSRIFKADPNELVSDELEKIPLIVMIDDHSASASEIFAGVVKECRSKKSKIVGIKSAGAVEVCNKINLSGYKFELYVTVADVRTMSGANLEGVGVLPDVEILLSEDDILNGKDSAMETAVDECLKLMSVK